MNRSSKLLYEKYFDHKYEDCFDYRRREFIQIQKTPIGLFIEHKVLLTQNGGIKPSFTSYCHKISSIDLQEAQRQVDEWIENRVWEDHIEIDLSKLNYEWSDKMEEKNLYYKVYRDRESLDGKYYVTTLGNLPRISEDWERENKIIEMLPPVFESILLTEDEFNNLPEFTGF